MLVGYDSSVIIKNHKTASNLRLHTHYKTYTISKYLVGVLDW